MANSTQLLEMLEKGRIREVMNLLRDDIYTQSLKKKPDVKRRYAAMKKYFMYAGAVRESLAKPCEVDYEGETYTAFCNSYSLALTKESTGELELLDDKARYPEVGRLINFEGQRREIDLNEYLAKAKSLGYKLKKSEFFKNDFLLHYDGAYFRPALLESTFAIIDDGNTPTVFHPENSLRPITITTSSGMAVVMPVRIEDPSDCVVVEVE